ncbi:MAG: hypothetical protein R2932_16595 [Caldilineaceae bacterium]
MRTTVRLTLMRDELRAQGLLPQNSPYAAAAATVDNGVFAVTGNDAIVDWVLVELRNNSNSAMVVASRAGSVNGTAMLSAWMVALG